MSSNQKSPPDNFVIPTPGPISNIPDGDTRKAPSFMDGNIPEQVFHFRKWGLSYGTDDKGHAASLILSVILAVLLAILFAVGSVVERTWLPDALKIIGTAFTFTAGVAIGKSSSNKGSK